jgi:phytoene dehydrogenase-like protein
MPRYDALVVGAGPNGLAAAITLARAGCTVRVIEAQATPGGGARSGALTRPGFVHDLGSAVHPFAVGSPFFRTLPLHAHGLVWVHPPAPLAHPFDDGTAAVLERTIDATAAQLGVDAAAYGRLMAPAVRSWERLSPLLLTPGRLLRHPLALTGFGLRALWPVSLLARVLFRGARARGLLAGISAHACLPLERPPSAAFGLVLGLLGHAVGWPFPRGGAQRLTDALVSYLRTLGGEIVTSQYVEDLTALPPARAILLDLAPRQVLRVAGDRLPAGYRRALERYRHGPGVFKVDWALDGPIPWTAPACARAGTIHLGGTLDELAVAERAPWRGAHAEQPFVLLAQPSRFDPTRAPRGQQTAWAYCHVPNGSGVDMTARVEAQIERFAPGFGARILARSVMGPAALEAYNPNLIGGDITGGTPDALQLFTRPAVRLNPYATPVRGLYLCSASTPPGPGVHGLCGYYAARAACRFLHATSGAVVHR